MRETSLRTPFPDRDGWLTHFSLICLNLTTLQFVRWNRND